MIRFLYTKHGVNTTLYDVSIENDKGMINHEIEKTRPTNQS